MAHENERDGLDSRLSDAERSDTLRRLATLAPAAARVDRDRLMFLAGQAQGVEVRGQRSEVGRSIGAPWLWPAATASLGATSLALLVALCLRPEPQVVFRDREAPARQQQPAVARTMPVAEVGVIPITLAAAQRPAAVAIPTNNYVRTREVALRMGLDAIGSPRRGGMADGAGAAPETYGSWLQSLTVAADGDGSKSSLPSFPNM